MDVYISRERRTQYELEDFTSYCALDSLNYFIRSFILKIATGKSSQDQVHLLVNELSSVELNASVMSRNDNVASLDIDRITNLDHVIIIRPVRGGLKLVTAMSIAQLLKISITHYASKLMARYSSLVAVVDTKERLVGYQITLDPEISSRFLEQVRLNLSDFHKKLKIESNDLLISLNYHYMLKNKTTIPTKFITETNIALFGLTIRRRGSRNHIVKEQSEVDLNDIQNHGVGSPYYTMWATANYESHLSEVHLCAYSLLLTLQSAQAWQQVLSSSKSSVFYTNKKWLQEALLNPRSYHFNHTVYMSFLCQADEPCVPLIILYLPAFLAHVLDVDCDELYDENGYAISIIDDLYIKPKSSFANFLLDSLDNEVKVTRDRIKETIEDFPHIMITILTAIRSQAISWLPTSCVNLQLNSTSLPFDTLNTCKSYVPIYKEQFSARRTLCIVLLAAIQYIDYIADGMTYRINNETITLRRLELS